MNLSLANQLGPPRRHHPSKIKTLPGLFENAQSDIRYFLIGNSPLTGWHKMYEDRIVIDPAVRHGKPIIKGTRVPLEIIIGSLAGGMEIEEIVKEYDLQKEDVLAALAYAARIIAGEEITAYAQA